MKLISKILRAPAVHFIVIGAVIFGLSGKATAPKSEIVIQERQIEQLRADIKAQTGLEPNAQQMQAAIEQTINDEVLYLQALKLKLDKSNVGVRHRLIQIARFVGDGSALSETAAYQKALDLGLDRTDLVVRRQLIANMKLIAAKVPTLKEPGWLTAEQIQTYYNDNKTHFEKPKRISFTHIYVSRDKWGKQAETKAHQLLRALQAKQVHPPIQDAPGDVFLSGNQFASSTPAMLQRFFGSQFVAQVFGLEPGKWQGPIVSSYGWHLVWVEGVKESQTPALTEVLNQVEGNILQGRETLRLNDALHELRSHYTIRIESNA